MKNYLLIILLLCAGAYSGYGQKKQPSDYHLQKAIDLIQNNGDKKEVMKCLDQQLQETPNNADARIARANLYYQQKKYGNALLDANLAIKYYKKGGMFPKYLMYWERARTYYDMEDSDKALADYDTAYKLVLKDKKGTTDIHDILYERAQIYYDLKDYANADADYRQMLKHDEADQVAMIGLIRNMIARKEYDAALELVNKCEKYDTDYDETYRFRMQIYDKTGEVDKAIDDAIAYHEKSENPSSELTNPIFKKHLSYALAKVTSKINSVSDNGSWKMLRVTIYELGHDYANAIKAYDDLEKEYGTSRNIYYYRADCYNEIGDTERAVVDMTKFIELGDGKDYFAIVRRADYYREGGKYEEAIADFTKGIELEPVDAYAYYKRGWCYELTGDDDSAMKDYNAGIDVDKSYPYIFLMRGH